MVVPRARDRTRPPAQMHRHAGTTREFGERVAIINTRKIIRTKKVANGREHRVLDLRVERSSTDHPSAVATLPRTQGTPGMTLESTLKSTPQFS